MMHSEVLLCNGISAADHQLHYARKYQPAVHVHLEHHHLAQPDQVGSNRDLRVLAPGVV